MAKITPKQERFVAEYLIDLNGTQAAIRAGYSPKTANEQASRLLVNVNVSFAIAEAQKVRSERTDITQDMVLRELAKIGFSDIRKAVRWANETKPTVENPDGPETLYSAVTLVPSEEIDDDMAAAIAEVSHTQQGIKIKLHDKKGALVDIGRHLGMFKDRVELTVLSHEQALAELDPDDPSGEGTASASS